MANSEANALTDLGKLLSDPNNSEKFMSELLRMLEDEIILIKRKLNLGVSSSEFALLNLKSTALARANIILKTIHIYHSVS